MSTMSEVEVYVDLKSIKTRYDALNRVSNNKIAPVIKNNCNQLGFRRMYEFFKEQGCKIVCCSYAKEFLLVANDTSMEKFAWNWRPSDDLLKIKRLTLVCNNIDQVNFCRKNNIEYFIGFDLGMSRGGFLPEEVFKPYENVGYGDGVKKYINVFTHCPHPNIEGIDKYEKDVLDLYKKLEERYEIKRKTACNTLLTIKKPHLIGDFARIGGGLVMPDLGYGLEPKIYRPLEVRTYISSKKKVEALNYVGYDWKCLDKDTDTAVIPIGYFTFEHQLNKVVVYGSDGPVKCDVLSMMHDMTVIDVTGVKCKVFDQVEIIGPDVIKDNMIQGPHRTCQFSYPNWLVHYNYIE